MCCGGEMEVYMEPIAILPILLAAIGVLAVLLRKKWTPLVMKNKAVAALFTVTVLGLATWFLIGEQPSPPTIEQLRDVDARCQEIAIEYCPNNHKKDACAHAGESGSRGRIYCERWQISGELGEADCKSLTKARKLKCSIDDELCRFDGTSCILGPHSISKHPPGLPVNWECHDGKGGNASTLGQTSKPCWYSLSESFE